MMSMMGNNLKSSSKMKHLFEYDKLLDFLRKNTAVSRNSIHVYYLDKHRKNGGGVPEYEIQVVFQVDKGKEKKQNFWMIGYEFKRMYAEGDTLFDGFLTSKEFIYLY